MSQNVSFTNYSIDFAQKFIGLVYFVIRRNSTDIIMFIFDAVNDHVFCGKSSVKSIHTKVGVAISFYKTKSETISSLPRTLRLVNKTSITIDFL